MGEIWLTKAECEQEIARRKAEHVLLQDTKGFKVRRDTGAYCTVRYDIDGQRFDVKEYDSRYNWAYVSNSIAFGSIEDANESIKSHRSEWKAYLGVEE